MPGTCRIFASVSGSPGDVHALRQAAQLPSPPREPVTLPTGPSRAPGERTHRLSRARRLAEPTREGNGHEQAPGR